MQKSTSAIGGSSLWTEGGTQGISSISSIGVLSPASMLVDSAAVASLASSRVSTDGSMSPSMAVGSSWISGSVGAFWGSPTSSPIVLGSSFDTDAVVS